MGNWNHLFCLKASFLIGLECQFLCVGQGTCKCTKQTHLYLWYVGSISSRFPLHGNYIDIFNHPYFQSWLMIIQTILQAHQTETSVSCVHIFAIPCSILFIWTFILFFRTTRTKSLRNVVKNQSDCSPRLLGPYVKTTQTVLLIYILNTVRVVLHYGLTSPLLRAELSDIRLSYH